MRRAPADSGLRAPSVRETAHAQQRGDAEDSHMRVRKLRSMATMAGPAWGRWLRWRRCAAVVGLVLAGICISWLGARATARNSAQHSRESFRLAAAQVDGSMDLEVQRETDLLKAAGAFMQQRRQIDPRTFQHWAADVGCWLGIPSLSRSRRSCRHREKVSGCPRVTTVGLHMTARMRSVGALDICRRQPALHRPAIAAA